MKWSGSIRTSEVVKKAQTTKLPQGYIIRGDGYSWHSYHKSRTFTLKNVLITAGFTLLIWGYISPPALVQAWNSVFGWITMTAAGAYTVGMWVMLIVMDWMERRNIHEYKWYFVTGMGEVYSKDEYQDEMKDNIKKWMKGCEIELGNWSKVASLKDAEVVRQEIGRARPELVLLLPN